MEIPRKFCLPEQDPPQSLLGAGLIDCDEIKLGQGETVGWTANVGFRRSYFKNR